MLMVWPWKKGYAKVMTRALMTQHVRGRVDALGVLRRGYEVYLSCFASLLFNNSVCVCVWGGTLLEIKY